MNQELEVARLTAYSPYPVSAVTHEVRRLVSYCFQSIAAAQSVIEILFVICWGFLVMVELSEIWDKYSRTGNMIGYINFGNTIGTNTRARASLFVDNRGPV